MIREKIVFTVEINGKEETFDSKSEAIAAKKRSSSKNTVKRLISVFRKYFKTYYNYTDKFSNDYLCVDCGKKLFTFSNIWNGHKYEKGACHIYENNAKTFDGYRCVACFSNICNLFANMIDFCRYEGNYTDKLFVGSIDELRMQPMLIDEAEKTPTILRMVDFYDKHK